MIANSKHKKVFEVTLTQERQKKDKLAGLKKCFSLALELGLKIQGDFLWQD